MTKLRMPLTDLTYHVKQKFTSAKCVPCNTSKCTHHEYLSDVLCNWAQISKADLLKVGKNLT